jgi:DNA-binding transcriptional LysR family regulator
MIHHWTLHQLRLFRSLGTHLSFTRVAEELHLTQPAVSIQIKRLEESVGLPLVEHMGKKLYLTDAGRELFEASRDVLEQLKRVLGQDMTDMEGRVRRSAALAPSVRRNTSCPIFWAAFCATTQRWSPA